MKPLLALSTLLTLSTSSQVPLGDVKPDLHRLHLPVMPAAPLNQPSIALADILGTQRSLTSFSSFARMDPATEERLSDLGTNTTVLAPLNSAVDALPRKPWEQPGDYAALGADAYEGDKGQDRARTNMRKFVEAHLVPESPWGENDKVKTVGGKEVWWVEKDGKRVVMPDEIEVEHVVGQVGNGELWILKGVLNYA
ncbi:FAS1 domain-containing protein [Fusarium keratoplasticum]|uniref:FAS1 domain-containing protein n=1 Tax=Fusarium keratoplasticum TaxID=1328300 RepID=A0ACC0RG50_9HYPO|nr:FAS1 domain-containing protein [Fusarium keratoplasticum]KAI8685037.1 FAS1 domain-containing protein [Fusarium keratoplasticum]KAI8689163.1 FAS1 domain-containing protein [Fusarium keratoplasticum]